MLLTRDLRLFLRAWERHHVRFGVVCSRPRLSLCSSLFPTACVEATVQELSAIRHRDDFAAAIVDDTLVYRFPYGHSNPQKRGARNPHFLNAAILQRSALSMLESSLPLRAIILPIPHIYTTEGLSFDGFMQRLTDFLAPLPAGFQYALELHNREYLLPEYFECLRRYGIIHVLSDSVTMQPVLDQIQLPHVLTTDRVVVRTTVKGDPEWRLGIIETVRRCIIEKKDLSVYLSDGNVQRMESRLGTLMEMLSGDLAKLSLIRRKAA